MNAIYKYILFLYGIPAVILFADLVRGVCSAVRRKKMCSSRGIARYGLYCFIPVLNLIGAMLIVSEFINDKMELLIKNKKL